MPKRDRYSDNTKQTDKIDKQADGVQSVKWPLLSGVSRKLIVCFPTYANVSSSNFSVFHNLRKRPQEVMLCKNITLTYFPNLSNVRQCQYFFMIFHLIYQRTAKSLTDDVRCTAGSFIFIAINSVQTFRQTS